MAALERDGVQITHISRSSMVTWFIRGLLPRSLQERYGTAPDVLVIYAAGAIQARDLRAARAEVFRSGLQLDVDLVIVADHAPELAARLRRLQGRGQRVAWEAGEAGYPSLQATLAQQLPTFDLFEERDPVRGTQVLGRKDEIAALIARVERGDAVGVFGLRKVGKTTLVRAVTDRLDPISASLSARVTPEVGADSSPVIAAWLDIQRVYRRTLEAVAASLGEALARRLHLYGCDISPAMIHWSDWTRSCVGVWTKQMPCSASSLMSTICSLRARRPPSWLGTGRGGIRCSFVSSDPRR